METNDSQCRIFTPKIKDRRKPLSNFICLRLELGGLIVHQHEVGSWEGDGAFQLPKGNSNTGRNASQNLYLQLQSGTKKDKS